MVEPVERDAGNADEPLQVGTDTGHLTRDRGAQVVFAQAHDPILGPPADPMPGPRAALWTTAGPQPPAAGPQPPTADEPVDKPPDRGRDCGQPPDRGRDCGQPPDRGRDCG
ncbi:hypothetical protein Asp14428_31570 [Actinoplanes sp. NBRC 14428]|nr:hypothetical protein Asp14428_31570 [Actinoplanes sp. NBRC 14428]